MLVVGSGEANLRTNIQSHLASTLSPTPLATANSPTLAADELKVEVKLPVNPPKLQEKSLSVFFLYTNLYVAPGLNVPAIKFPPDLDPASSFT